MKTFVYPATAHLLRVGAFKKTDREAGAEGRAGTAAGSVKRILVLPPESRSLLAEESDMYGARVDAAFKLLTSLDGRVASDAEEHLSGGVVHERLREPPDRQAKMNFLTGMNEGATRAPAAGVANVWTRARNASRRAGVARQLEDGDPVLAIPSAAVRLG